MMPHAMKTAAKPKNAMRNPGMIVESLFSWLLLLSLYWLAVVVGCTLCVTVTIDSAPAGGEVPAKAERVRMMRVLLEVNSRRLFMEDGEEM